MGSTDATPTAYTWRAICLGHDPALIVDPNSGGYTDLRPLLDELAVQADRPHTKHPHCDMLAGRFATEPIHVRDRLLTVVCPPKPGTGDHDHELGEAVDARWLSLLAAVLPDRAHPVPAGTALAEAARALPACWTGERVRRLGPLLNPGGRRG